MRYYTGLDIGGTNGRLKICDLDGSALGTFLEEGCSINTDGCEKSRLRCRQLILPVLQTLGLKAEDCAGICVAASGIDSPALEAAMRDIFEEMGFRAEVLQVMNDCEIFLHLSEGPALVVIAGTGSICFGRGPAGQVVRTGGWNHIVSDEGSGFDMGLKVLKAAADALDGRIPRSLLTELVIRESGLDSLEVLNDFINDHLFEKSEIARFALTGYTAAVQGDETALAIQKNCADALYGLIADTVRKLDLTLDNGRQEADLWLWGSVAVKNQIVRRVLTQRLNKDFPSLQIRVPELSALDVAVMAAAEGTSAGISSDPHTIGRTGSLRRSERV